MEKIITAFGSGLVLPHSSLYIEIEQIGRLLAENKFTVCSGGYYGIMKAISKGAKAANGKTYGITLSGSVSDKNKYIDEETKMPNLMERFAELIALGDAFIIFKGGTGTLSEISLTLEFMNKKAMKEKPLIFYTSFWKNTIDSLKLDSTEVNSLIERNVNFAHSPAEVISVLQSRIKIPPS